MSEHERFEELASLAAVGELSPEEWEEFRQHKQDCRRCDELVSATTSLATVAFLAGSPEEESSEVKASRHRRAREAVARRLPLVVWAPSARRYGQLVAAGIAAAFLLGTGVGMGVQARRKSVSNSVQPPAGLPFANSIPSSRPAVSESTVQSQAKTDAVQAEMRLSETRNEKRELAAKLAASEQRATDLEKHAKEIESQSSSRAQDALNARNELSELQKELNQSRDSVSRSQATIDSLRYRLADREARLAEVTVDMEREHEMLSSGREIRDIMGARDLHIVDVVDRDGKGRTRRAFGRAFYTQGKSLIFYAFDLPDKNTADGKYVYTAWGSNSNDLGGKTARSLGIFFNDDQTQHRWAMKFDDPRILEQIDTVFVTLEPSGHSPKLPTGKALLEAYFGTPPNHP